MAGPRRHQTAPTGEDNNERKDLSAILRSGLKAFDKIQAQYMVFVVLALAFIAWMYFARSNIDATVGAAMVLFLVFSFGCFAFFLENKDRELSKLREMKEMLERQLRYAGEEYVRLRYKRPAGTKAKGKDSQPDVDRHE